VELDPTGQYLLVAAGFDDKVQVIDVAQQQIVADLPVGTFPLQIAFNSTGETAVVTNLFSDSFSVIHVDGAASTVEGTYSSQGQKPLRLAYNPVADEFGIVVLDSKKVINVDAGTGTINSTDYYSSYGSPVQIKYDVQGKPLVLVMSDGDNESKIIKDKNEVIELPATPTFFSYCEETNTAAVCMPGPDFVTVIEYELNTNPPVADFEADVTVIQAGDYVEFTDLSDNDPTEWQWSFEGGTPDISTEQNPTVQYEVPGTFDVTLTATNAYGSDTKTVEDYISVDTLTFTGSSEVIMNMSVFPNPVPDKLYITLNEKPLEKVYVSVFDINGRMLITKRITGLKNVIDMQNLQSGVYLLKVSAGGEVKMLKITKR
jgi:YVTN family beta-propeller protein